MNTVMPSLHKAALWVMGLVLAAGLMQGWRMRPHEIASANTPTSASMTMLDSDHPAHPFNPDTGGPTGAAPLDPPTPGEIIQQLITLVINFPANTIRDAIRKALLGILQGEAKLLREGLVGMASATLFQTESNEGDPADLFGRVNVSAMLRDLETVLTVVAVPLWGLGLVMLALAMVIRNATAAGFELGDIAYEFVRWVLICFCSGNGMGIANMVHIGFNLLAAAVLNGGGINANTFIDALLPAAAVELQTFPIVILIIMMIVSAAIVVVMALSYIARAVMVLAFVGLAPLAIAAEGIPFTRFVFREWLNTFLRIELLQIINAVAFLIWVRVLAGMAGSASNVQSLLEMERMQASYLGPILLSMLAAVGFASVVIAINWSVFKYVFGVAIDVSNGLQRAAGAVFGFLSTAFNGGSPSPALALGAAATGSPFLQSMTSGQRLGQQQHQLANPTTPTERQQERNAGATQRPTAAHDQQSPESQRNAQFQSRARQQQQRALARESGARSEGEIDSIVGAYGQLAERYGEENTTRAAKSAATQTSQQVRQHGRGGNGLAQAAHANGASSVGAFVGGAVEDAILSEQGRSNIDSGQRVFSNTAQRANQSTPSPTASSSQAASAIHSSDSRNTTPTHGQNPSASEMAIGNTARMSQEDGRAEATRAARSTGARGSHELGSVTSAYETLAGQYGRDAANQAFSAVAPAARAMTRQQGSHKGSGLTRAAQSQGYADAGHWVGRMAEDSILQTQGMTASDDQSVFASAHQSGQDSIASQAPSTPTATPTKSAPPSQGSSQSPGNTAMSSPMPRSQGSQSAASQLASSPSQPAAVTQADAANTSPTTIEGLMSQQPSPTQPGWRQTQTFDRLAGQHVLSALHGDSSRGPAFADMMRDIRQLPASMSAATGDSSTSQQGLFPRTLLAAERIGQQYSEPQQAFTQFQTFMDGELARSGETGQVRVPWRSSTPSSQQAPKAPTNTRPAAPPPAPRPNSQGQKPLGKS